MQQPIGLFLLKFPKSLDFRAFKTIQGFSLLFFCSMLLFFSSCSKEVKIDIPGYEEKLVVDGRIETGQPPLVILSRTQEIYSATDLNSFLNSFVSGAVVTVSDGTNTVQLDEVCTDNLPPGSEAFAAQLFGIPEDELANYHLCAYTTFDSSMFGTVGKTYTLTVQFEGRTYTSSTQILVPVALNSTYWKEDEDAPGHGFSWANMTDPANQYDAYMWEVKRLKTGSDGQPKDATFYATYSPVFDDDFIKGQTFDFYYENPRSYDDEDVADENRGYFALGDTVVIKFSVLDRGVFEFLEKKYLQLQTTGNPFSSPTVIPTNITGGALGVWAGYSPTFDTLICVP